MPTLLLVDLSFLSHRARHTTGNLSFQGVMTGVAFGVLRDLEMLQSRFNPSLTVLACDHYGKKLRRDLLPTYKTGRDTRKTDEERALDKLFYEQMTRLRVELLPAMGYRNIIEVAGYEADDIIAHYASLVPDGSDAVIVSSDHDLWQCIRFNVVCFNPAKSEIINETVFRQEFEVGPERWAEIKALAGCETDDVPGVRGIGEKTAAKYFAGKLKPGKSKKDQAADGKYEKIVNNLDVIERNLPLVKLPFAGLVVPQLVNDELTEERRIAVQEVLGIRRSRVGRMETVEDPIGAGETVPDFLF